MAYQAIVAWAPAEASPPVDQECQRLWDQTCQKLEHPPLWPAVHKISQRMIWEGTIFDETAVLELISPEGEPGWPEP
jgi:hypothetical protein